MSETATVTAIQHFRANRVVIENQFGTTPVIYFEQEAVLEVGEQSFQQQLSPIHRELTQETAGTPFEVFDQITGKSIGTFTYWDFANIVRSLFNDTSRRVQEEQLAEIKALEESHEATQKLEDARIAEDALAKESADKLYADLQVTATPTTPPTPSTEIILL
jgi:hypothetical protein